MLMWMRERRRNKEKNEGNARGLSCFKSGERNKERMREAHIEQVVRARTKRNRTWNFQSWNCEHNEANSNKNIQHHRNGESERDYEREKVWWVSYGQIAQSFVAKCQERGRNRERHLKERERGNDRATKIWPKLNPDWRDREKEKVLVVGREPHPTMLLVERDICVHIQKQQQGLSMLDTDSLWLLSVFTLVCLHCERPEHKTFPFKLALCLIMDTHSNHNILSLEAFS